ncbi:MAG: hypothetical protein AB8B68_01080 [Rickettsiaceae bacterium]
MKLLSGITQFRTVLKHVFQADSWENKLIKKRSWKKLKRWLNKAVLKYVFQTSAWKKLKKFVKTIYYKKKGLCWFVIMPIVVFAFYMIMISPNRWVAESKVAVKSVSSGRGDISALGFIIGDLNPSTREDIFFLKEYIYSYDMLEYLNRTIDLYSLYRRDVWDPFYRLFKGVAKEDALSYYKSKVLLVLEENKGVLLIATQGFRSQDAKKINDAILERSEWFLNEISHKIAKNEALFFEDQIKQAAKRMNEAKKAIISFQVENNIINPSTQVESGAKLIARLIGDLASHETELRTLKSYLSENSPQVISTQSKILALKGQINKESKVIVGGDKQALNSISLEFQDLEIEAKIAEQIYEATIASLEKNRLDSFKKFKSLVVVSEAILPEKSILPKRLYNIILFAIVIGAVYGSVRLILTSIKEHI